MLPCFVRARSVDDDKLPIACPVCHRRAKKGSNQPRWLELFHNTQRVLLTQQEPRNPAEVVDLEQRLLDRAKAGGRTIQGTILRCRKLLKERAELWMVRHILRDAIEATTADRVVQLLPELTKPLQCRFRHQQLRHSSCPV